MDLVGPIIEIVKCVGRPTVRYLKHQIKFKDNLEKFQGSKEDLCRRKRDIESRLITEVCYGKVAKAEVQRWLKDVEDFIARQDVADEVNGWGCLSCCCRVKILEERAQELKAIYGRGDKYTNECLVIDDPSAWAVELPVPELQGSEAVKAKILACLKGEEVTKLGVWGMCGVGKTTIMKHVHNELLKEGKFKKIIWLSVLQNFDIYELQEQIACSLGEQKQLEEKQNIATRAAKLSDMLKEDKHKPYLMILDDVWRSFELNEVGIPEPNVNNGCKLVLTTRSQEIARSMGCKTIKVETLSGEEALKLFLNKVGDTVLSCHGGGVKKALESTLKEIVDECNGLPLAIVTVAYSLKQISDPCSWSVALNELRDCKRNVAGTEDDDDAFKILKFSYDRLKNQKIQYCFLYCALYPEDYNIPKDEIIEYWIDEGFIDEMETRHAMKDEGRDILRKLEENSLLEFSKDRHERDCVRMHDLIRDMALEITRTSPRFLVEAGKALRELPEKVKCTEDVEKVSLMWNQIEEIPSSMASSTCRRLTTLLLAYNRLSTIPQFVFEHMPELKILDLSFNEELRSLPNSFSKLVNLTTLLLESTSLEMVPSLCSLGSLKKLNLRGTAIKEVPEGLGMLTNLKCLALCGSDPGDTLKILKISEIADGVLSNLSELEELIVNSSRIELKGEVVGRLKKLEVFHGWFPTMNEMRIFLTLQPDKQPSSYFVSIGSNLQSDYLPKPPLAHKLRRLCKKVMAFKEVSIVGENALFSSVQELFIEACEDVRSLNDFSAIKDETVTDLRGCWIVNCGSMEWVLSSWINNPIVQTLEFLVLWDLPKLDGLFGAKVIAKSTPPPGAFSSLNVVYIEGCDKIKKLFPSLKLVEYLQSLESISVKDCGKMEEIIASDDPEEERGGGDIIRKLILPKLKQLHLSNLPKLDGLFGAKVIAKSTPPPGAFSSLNVVYIEGCDKIKKLFPSLKLVEYLQSLESISVKDCGKMEEIIASDDPEEERGGGDIIRKLILPKLKQLHLSNLPALKSICSGKRAVMACDSLEFLDIQNCNHKGLREIVELDGLFEAQVIAKSRKVWIGGCDKIKKLFPSWKLVEYLPSLEEIYVFRCEEMEEIIASDPEEEGEDIIKKLILPKLKKLQLHDLPTLKSICSGKRAVMACDSLEWLHIRDCKSLRGIFVYLPSPPYLFVSDLDKLDGLFEAQVIAPNSPPPPAAFSSLKTIEIERCHKIKKLFPSWKLVEYLPSLEKIEVMSCKEMEEIIASDPEKEGKEGGDIIKKLILPELKELKLSFLPALKSICSGKRAVMACDSLEEICIINCGGLRGIFVYLPSPPYLFVSDLDKLDGLFEAQVIGPPPPTAFSSLKTITIERCKKIKKLFPSWKLVENLQSLEEIIVCDCKQMEEIIASDLAEGEKGGVTKLFLPKVKRLHLELLPALKSISNTRVKMVCDSLEHIQILQCHQFDNLDALFEEVTLSSLKTIWINGCGKIKKLFPSRLLLRNLQSLEEINVGCCEQMKELVASDPGGEKKGVMDVSLPKLKRLRLEFLPTLEVHSITAVMVCASLEEIQILACQRLMRIPLYQLDNLDAPFEAKVFSKSPQPPSIYSSLRTISIIECGNIKKLLPSRFLLGNLQSLEEIIVRDCEQMEEIIALDPEEEEEEEEEAEKGGVIKLILPKLKKLHLELLPALKSISSTRVKMVCDSLEHIQILQCCYLDNLDALFEVEGISMSPPPPGICPSLKTISIGYCYKIKKLFPSWMLQGNLQSLEEINVRHCVQMEELISLEPEEGVKEGLIKVALPKLKRLKLIYLPTLKRMCSTRAEMVCDSLQHVEILRCFHLEKLDAVFKAVKFSTLETIWINGCGKIKKLIPSGSLSLQSLEEMNVSCCEQMEELVEKEEDKDLILPKLKKLHLECLPALEIHSITAVMVCASLEEIQILACQCLRRIPLYHLDNLEVSKSLQPPAIYSSLKTISIIECGTIKKLLLSRFLLGNLQSLEEIIVHDCEQMEEIIALEAEDEEETGEVVKLILPKLKKLHLELLPALKNICNTRVKVVCDYLEHIQILQCHHLDNLDDLFEVEGNSMSSPPPGICSSLKTIRIDGCSKIKKLFPSRLLLGYLQSLEEINVRFCEQMEDLVASNPEGGELVMDLILPKLKWVELEGLPALKSI